jgi:hypothetical protein
VQRQKRFSFFLSEKQSIRREFQGRQAGRHT